MPRGSATRSRYAPGLRHGSASCAPAMAMPCRRRSFAEITREHARLRLVAEQIASLEAESREVEAAAPAGTPPAKLRELTQLVGIGPTSARLLVNEVFYRRFDNRRQLGGYFGLTGTPYDSGACLRAAAPG
jgi:transposase